MRCGGGVRIKIYLWRRRGGTDRGGRGTAEAAEDDEPTGNDNFGRQFLTVQLQKMGWSWANGTKVKQITYLLFSIYFLSTLPIILFTFLVASVVADYSKDKVDGGILCI